MFKEHPDLIAGFAQFLPETASVTYDGREPRKRAADALGNLVPGIAAKRLKALGGNAVDSSKPLSERLGLAGAEQPDEYKFFEMLKEHLPKPVYAQYLKLLTLFSHEIIDRRALVEQSKPYFGRGPAAKELRRMLRAIVKPRARIRDYVMTSGLPAIVSQQVEAASKEEGEQEEEEDKRGFLAPALLDQQHSHPVSSIFSICAFEKA